MSRKAHWINILNLLPHPEGGFYRESYRATGSISAEALPARYAGSRAFVTHIYFMLVAGNFSAFHKVASDETWHFYDGSPVILYLLDENEGLKQVELGIDGDSEPQFTVPADTWMAAEVKDGSEFSLVGCSVAPGFDFADFTMAKRDELYRQFPLEIVQKFCRE